MRVKWSRSEKRRARSRKVKSGGGELVKDRGDRFARSGSGSAAGEHQLKIGLKLETLSADFNEMFPFRSRMVDECKNCSSYFNEDKLFRPASQQFAQLIWRGERLSD